MAKPAVFLDSSVIIASLLSATGGSFYIMDVLKDDMKLQTSEYGLIEMQNILKSKFATSPDLQSRLFLMLGTAKVAVLPIPVARDVKWTQQYISKIDAPILASALRHSDYLITLDNEFFKPDVMSLAGKKSLAIMKPKEFIERFRK
jgi:predicted nucleic acid-binding protein